MENTVVERHNDLLNSVELEARMNGTKLHPNTIVVTGSEDGTELKYINLNRLQENLHKGQLDSLSSEILNHHHVVELASGSEFVAAQVGQAQFYDEELLSQELTEEDKSLAAALVAVQFSQKQQSLLNSELLKSNSMSPLSPLQSVNVEKPTVSAMVNSYFQDFDDDGSQHQLLDPTHDRIMKIYQPQTNSPLPEIRLPPLPPLKKVMTTQTIVNRYRMDLLDKEKVVNRKDILIEQQEEEVESDYEGENGNLKTSKRSLPHKKRIPRKLKTQPNRNIQIKFSECSKCGASFDTQAAFLDHKEGSCKRTIFSCQICCYQEHNQIKFFEHLKGHYEPTLQTSNMHQDNIIEYEDQQTPMINDSFSLKTDQSDLKELTCNQCNRVFRRQKAYDTHISTAHPQIEEFSEPEDMMEGIRHVVDIQADSPEIEDSKMLSWNYGEELNIQDDTTKPLNSDLDFTGNPTDELDLKGKKPKKLVQCPQCSRTFSHRNSLVYHIRSHTGRRPHQCDVCGKGFFAANALRVHMRMHSGDKPYKCEVCHRHFRQWGDLKYHMTSLHSTTKQYQCEFCGKDFARKYSLIVHRRIHTGEKNYICEFCRKSFRASSYLVNHRRIHTGEKPYNCDVCHKPFRVKSDMKRHRNTHNKEHNVTIEQRLPDSTSDAIEKELKAESESSLPMTFTAQRAEEQVDALTYPRDPLERDTNNTLFVWIPNDESILPD